VVQKEVEGCDVHTLLKMEGYLSSEMLFTLSNIRLHDGMKLSSNTFICLWASKFMSSSFTYKYRYRIYLLELFHR
jgi:hypothetical protein